MWRKWSILVLIIFVGGCVATKDARYDRLKSKHPDWDEQTLRQVADRQVAIGMTEEMVLAALGKPSLREDGHWQYKTYRVDGEGWTHVSSVFSIYFQDNKVINTGGYQHRRRKK